MFRLEEWPWGYDSAKRKAPVQDHKSEAQDQPATKTEPDQRPAWYKTGAQMLVLQKDKDVAKQVDQMRRAVKCLICNRASVAPLVRVDRVLAPGLIGTADAEGREYTGREYIHGPCIQVLEKRYQPKARAKHHRPNKTVAA